MDVDAVAIGSFFAGPTFTAPPAAAVKAAQRSASHLSASPTWPAEDTAARADERCSVDSSHEQVTTSLEGAALGSTSRASLLAASKALCSYTCAARVVQTRLHWRQRRREVPAVLQVHA